MIKKFVFWTLGTNGLNRAPPGVEHQLGVVHDGEGDEGDRGVEQEGDEGEGGGGAPGGGGRRDSSIVGRSGYRWISLSSIDQSIN